MGIPGLYLGPTHRTFYGAFSDSGERHKNCLEVGTLCVNKKNLPCVEKNNKLKTGERCG